jgi:ATP-dependent Clp protease ATP-binding subunit ClpC
MVDAEGKGKEGKFIFNGVPKPEAVPDTPPAELAEAAGSTRGEIADRRPES